MPHSQKKKFISVLIGSLFLLWLGGCARAPLKKRSDALRLTSAPNLQGDIDFKSLLPHIKEHAQLILEKEESHYEFGTRRISKEDLSRGLKHFVFLAEKYPDAKEFEAQLKRDFDFYEPYGYESWGKVFLTSYFVPVIKGSVFRTEKYSEPLLGIPKDLVHIDVETFDRRFSGIRRMRGRRTREKNFRGIPKILPYYSRREISEGNLWKRKGLVLCWVDPIDAFFLQIQGSGTVKLEDGRTLSLGFAEQNGHPYRPIGKDLTHLIPIEEMTMEKIEAHLHALPKNEAKELMYKNPSFVFFRKLKGQAITTFGSEAISGRTIATDPKFYPKGAIAFLKFNRPEFEKETDFEPKKWVPTARWVLDQDTGGIIRRGAVDYFWGKGPQAKKMASVIKQEAELYYLAPKENLIHRWNSSNK